jgi:hypothetical protein
MMQLVQVYKSLRKAETYLYVPKDTDLSTLPSALLTLFGAAEAIMLLALTADKQLARCRGADVLDALAKQGFYLQLPPGNREEERVC